METRCPKMEPRWPKMDEDGAKMAQEGVKILFLTPSLPPLCIKKTKLPINRSSGPILVVVVVVVVVAVAVVLVFSTKRMQLQSMPL